MGTDPIDRLKPLNHLGDMDFATGRFMDKHTADHFGVSNDGLYILMDTLYLSPKRKFSNGMCLFIHFDDITNPSGVNPGRKSNPIGCYLKPEYIRFWDLLCRFLSLLLLCSNRTNIVTRTLLVNFYLIAYSDDLHFDHVLCIALEKRFEIIDTHSLVTHPLGRDTINNRMNTHERIRQYIEYYIHWAVGQRNVSDAQQICAAQVPNDDDTWPACNK